MRRFFVSSVPIFEGTYVDFRLFISADSTSISIPASWSPLSAADLPPGLFAPLFAPKCSLGLLAAHEIRADLSVDFAHSQGVQPEGQPGRTTMG